MPAGSYQGVVKTVQYGAECNLVTFTYTSELIPRKGPQAARSGVVSAAVAKLSSFLNGIWFGRNSRKGTADVRSKPEEPATQENAASST